MSALLISFVFIVFLFAAALFAIYERRNRDLLNDTLYEMVLATSHSLGRELSAIESLGMDLLTDGTIREALREMSSDLAPYERFEITSELGPRLRLYTSLSYVHGVVAVASDGRPIHSGGDVPRLYRMLDREEIESFVASEDAQRWIVPGNDSNRLFYLRTVRDADTSSFDELGVIVVVVNKDSLARTTVTSPFGESLELDVLYRAQPVYTYRSGIATSLDVERIGRGSYSVENIEGDRYFVATGYSSDRALTFVYGLPYHLLFSSVQDLRLLFTIVGLILCAVLVALSTWLARDVSEPIVRLARHMGRLEGVNFRKGVSDLGATSRDDEIGVLHREFALMLDRIDSLIGERYRSEIALKDAQFRSLQLQVNPHFLYNTLDSINWLAQLSDHGEIVTMVQSLGTLLRASLDNRTPAVTLEQELNLLEHYIRIQKTRYSERLDVAFDIDDRCRQCGVPKLTLQPLVENAIKYGLEQIELRCRIRISALPVDGNLELRIADNGQGMDREYAEAVLAGTVVTHGSGVGIRNIIERLRWLYSDRARVDIDSEHGTGTTIILSLPCEAATALIARMHEIGGDRNASDDRR